jgi:carbonyl reductase 1
MHTILACRNPELGDNALQYFKQHGYDAEVRQLDISNRKSIEDFAQGMERDFDRLDVLVNNAAIAFKSSDPTPFQQQARPTFHTNYYGTLWATQALLPLLQKSSHPRIVNVASEAGHLRIIKNLDLKATFSSPRLTLDELNNLVERFIQAVEEDRHKDEGWPETCYGLSKLSVIAMTQILAREHANILINACCPGYCDTDMTSHRGPRPAEVGARTPALLALLPDDSTVTGKFYANEEDITSSW